MLINQEKEAVRAFWNQASCGEAVFLDQETMEGYQTQLQKRYAVEPFILPFANFDGSPGKEILEIGVGLGADHQMWAQGGAVLTGVDLTDRAISHVQTRLSLLGLHSNLQVADAENLPFSDETFDTVYSWGVLHHSPNTGRAIQEVYRVLKPGGAAKIMIYHTWSVVGFMLWVRYALLRLRPWITLSEIYDRYLESPGTKAYTRGEAMALFSQFKTVNITIELSGGDLMSSHVGQRHQGVFLTLAKRFFPRGLIQKWMPGLGLFMLITAQK